MLERSATAGAPIANLFEERCGFLRLSTFRHEELKH